MNFLRNPIAVALLCVAALALIGMNVIWPVIHRNRSARRPVQEQSANRSVALPKNAGSTSTRAGVTVIQSDPVQPDQQQVEWSGPSIELASLETKESGWLRSSWRDPFGFWNESTNANSARNLLKLGGVWRQTGATLIVVNNQVLKQGDSILGFTIETIEEHRVWVQGPNGRESIEFKHLGPADDGGSDQEKHQEPSGPKLEPKRSLQASLETQQ